METEGPLLLQARLNVVERRLTSLRLRLALFSWAYVPVLLLGVVIMVRALLMGFGEPGPILGGAVAILGAAAAMITARRKVVDELDDLEEEREARLAEIKRHQLKA